MPHDQTADAAPALSLQREIARIASLPGVRAAFTWLHNHEDEFAKGQLEMARIPAPPFGEAARGDWLEQRFREIGLTQISRDEAGNVFGLHPGEGSRCISLSAHIDTVFPA